jgi:hypothetical protein
MAILVFLLGLILATAGVGGLLASIDLLPTELGVLYAGCGTVAVSTSFIVFAIAALILRVDAMRKALRGPQFPAPASSNEPTAVVLPEQEPILTAPAHLSEEAPATAPDVVHEPVAREAPAEEEPLNENRAGHLPTFAEVEHAIAQPEAPPNLVGRYSAGGANYMIFSDGTIEAETEQGAFRFASMGDFKAYIAGRRN